MTKETKIGLIVAALVVVVCAIFIPGCTQTTQTPTTQTPVQEQPTRSKNAQETDTFGTHITNNYHFEAPNNNYGMRGRSTSQPSEAAALLSALNAPAGSIGASRADGYNQTFVLNWSTQTGGTAPSVTGSSSAAATATQTPTASGTTDARQDPRFTASTPIAFGMPGSAPSASGSAASEGATASTTQTNEQRAMQQDIRAMRESIDALLKALAPASTPAGPQEPPPADTSGASGS